MCIRDRAEDVPATPLSDRREIPKGRVVPAVPSVAKPEQSYALYLPAAYAAERRWPIVYVFDPGGQGRRPVELMRGAADRFGYLVAASNNSRNGPWQASLEAAAEMWDDTRRRLSIDERRIYFAGFSGGARVAATLAQSCGCARGVFLVGAGFHTASPPTRRLAFSVFALVGWGDFNYDELVELDAELDRLGVRHALRRFDGDHRWAPAAEWDGALAWSTLAEMKDGLRYRDAALVAAELARVVQRGRARERTGETAVALAEYRSALTVLDGLADTTAIARRIAALEEDPSVRSAREQEQADLRRQRVLETDILGLIDALREAGGDRIPLQVKAGQKIHLTHKFRIIK